MEFLRRFIRNFTHTKKNSQETPSAKIRIDVFFFIEKNDNFYEKNLIFRSIGRSVRMPNALKQEQNKEEVKKFYMKKFK